MIKVLGITFAIMIGLLFTGYVVNSISNELMIDVALILIALTVAILAIMAVGSRPINPDDIYSDVTGDDIFPIANERKIEDAVTILKRRYANGEINSYEYTEKMSRL